MAELHILCQIKRRLPVEKFHQLRLLDGRQRQYHQLQQKRRRQLLLLHDEIPAPSRAFHEIAHNLHAGFGGQLRLWPVLRDRQNAVRISGS